MLSQSITVVKLLSFHLSWARVSQLLRSPKLLFLREAFASLLPIVLVMNILVLLSGLDGLLQSWGINWASHLNGDEINRLFHFLLPLFVNLSLSTLLAKEKELDPIGTLLISMVCFFRLSGFLAVAESTEVVSGGSSLFSAVPCAFGAVLLLHYFSRVFRFRFKARSHGLSPRLQKTLNLLIPGLLTLLSFELFGDLWRGLWSLGIASMGAELLPRFSRMGDISELLLYKLVSLPTWFMGLHGEHAAAGLLRLLKDLPPSEPQIIQLKTFHDVFMNIGGSGSTFVIPWLILLTRKARAFNFIAQLSLPFAFFNVNEILLFGLPVILNPVMFIPFMLAPFCNMLITLLAVKLGLFSIVAVELHWMSPPLYSAFMATGGSVVAMLVQLLCIVLDGLIYYPFLVLAANQSQAPDRLIKIFDQDVSGLINEHIAHREERSYSEKQLADLEDTASMQQVLKLLKGGEFLLYFQPKVDAHSLDLEGLEVLLRFQTSEQKIVPPTFLPLLYRQGLSKFVDRQVVELVFKQVTQWRSQGLQYPSISINFDKEFLLDPLAVKDLIARAKVFDICFDIEITEHTYTAELEHLAQVVRQFRAAGHRISIDDFGAGYSSLTTLVALEADEIKLDRQLLLAPEAEVERGNLLFCSSVKLCHDLGFKVVAEGVETSSQLQLVQNAGADVVQGYFTGRPMDAEQVSQLFGSRLSDSRVV